MKLKALLNKIDKLKAAQAEMDGETMFYDVDTTIIGDKTELKQIFYTGIDNNNTITITDETDGQTIFANVDGKNVADDVEIDWLVDGIAIYNRMINKTLRVWRSDNPDAEEEREEPDDED